VSDEKKQQLDKGEAASPKRQPMPRDCNEVAAVNPWTGATFELYVRNGTVNKTARKGMGAAKELMYTVLHAIQKPTAVYRGVTEFDDGDEDWLIYVTVPPYAYDHKTGDTVRAWKGEVFLVFVDEDRVIRQWYWDDADPVNPRLPVNHDQGRFVEKLL
jgi:hypothetical protein